MPSQRLESTAYRPSDSSPVGRLAYHLVSRNESVWKEPSHLVVGEFERKQSAIESGFVEMLPQQIDDVLRAL